MNHAPACPCGATYAGFRAERIRSYADAYHEIAWTREHTSRAAVLRHWAASKAAEWARHLEVCAWEAEAAVESGPLPEDGDATFDVAALAFDPVCDEWGGEPLAPTAPEPPAETAPARPQAAPGTRRAPRTPIGRPRSQKPPQGPPKAPHTGSLPRPPALPSGARGPPVRFSRP